MVPFPRSYILECSSICSLHSFPSTMFTPSWWPKRSLANPFLKPVSTLIITVQTWWAGPCSPSYPGGLISTYTPINTTARHCDWTMSAFNPTFRLIPFHLSAVFWSSHPHSSVTKKGCSKLYKLYGAGVYRALPWLGVEWRMGIQVSQDWNFSPGD